MNSDHLDAMTKNILEHMHRRTVVGSINSIGMLLRMKNVNAAMNPRYKDLKALSEQLGDERREMFYAGAAAIAEFAAYLVLDFIETYNRFESDDNDEDVPTLCLSYRRRSQDGVETTALSTFGTERLGQLFKQVSQQDNVKALVDSAISDRAPDSHPSPGVPPCRW